MNEKIWYWILGILNTIVMLVFLMSMIIEIAINKDFGLFILSSGIFILNFILAIINISKATK